jgi:hypothetical protein
MIEVTAGTKLVYRGKELMLPGRLLTVKAVHTYIVDEVFETMVLFDETGHSEYNIRFFQPSHSAE